MDDGVSDDEETMYYKGTSRRQIEKQKKNVRVMKETVKRMSELQDICQVIIHISEICLTKANIAFMEKIIHGDQGRIKMRQLSISVKR